MTGKTLLTHFQKRLAYLPACHLRGVMLQASGSTKMGHLHTGQLDQLSSKEKD